MVIDGDSDGTPAWQINLRLIRQDEPQADQGEGSETSNEESGEEVYGLRFCLSLNTLEIEGDDVDPLAARYDACDPSSLML